MIKCIRKEVNCSCAYYSLHKEEEEEEEEEILATQINKDHNKSFFYLVDTHV